MKKRIVKESFSRKESDLFSLEQTKDLTGRYKEVEDRLLSLEYPLRLGAIKTTDMSAMRYKRGDYLLCHDDMLEGRKFAYILYLKSPDIGGELSLISDKTPYKKKKILPKENRLVVFKVSKHSWHEVEEIERGERLSIGGWFY